MPIKIISLENILNITHINTNDIAGGAAKVAWRLTEAQRNKGHNVNILVGFKQDNSEVSIPFNLEVNQDLQKICAIKGELFYEFQGSHKLIHHPVVQSADVLHFHNLHGWYFNPFSIILLSRIKPTVWTLHDMQAITGHCAHSFDCEKWRNGCGECPDLTIYPPISNDATKQLWKDKKLIYENSLLWIVTPSQWLKDKVEKSILKPHPIELIYNGVNTNIFKPFNKKEIRSFLNLPEDALIIGCIAEFGIFANVWKGGQYTFKVIEALKEKFPNCLFLNIGSTGYSGIPYIIDIPRVKNETELAMLYSCLDIFLYTSIADNCPLTILEALSCGTPIIAFATGGVPELIRNEIDGLIVGYKDIESLIRTVIRLANDSALRKKFSINSRENAVKNFDHRIIVEKYEDLYLRCIERFKSLKNNLNLLMIEKFPEVIKTHIFLDSFKKVTKLEYLDLDNLSISLNDKAVSKIKQGDKEGAKEAFLEIIKNHPSFYPAYNNLACLYWDEGDFENAERYFEEAIEVVKNQAIGNRQQEIIDGYRSVIMGYGEMLMRLKKYKKAKELFEEYLKNNPEDKEVKGMFDKCEKVLEKVKILGKGIG